MYISTEIDSFRKYGDDYKVLRMLKDAGFTAYDFSIFNPGWLEPNLIVSGDDYLERAKALRAYADGIGLPCNQAHAPFPTYIHECVSYEGVDNAEYNARAKVEIRRAIEIAGILGAKVCVVHPCNDYTPEENALLYREFEDVARKAGVKIGVENMWNWKHGEAHACAAACSHHDNFKAHMDLLPKDVFVACLDIGHAEMAGLDTDLVQMIERLGDDLQALHIHDNDCVHDQHALPFTRSICFEGMLDALKRIGYKGDITMEACRFAEKFPLELYPACARLMADIGKYMRDQLLEK